MNTLAHITIGLTVLDRGKQWRNSMYVFVGSLLPDVPIVICYLVEKWWRQTPDWRIWRESYFAPGWQTFIDMFNALPLIIPLLLVGMYAKMRWLVLLAAAMLLHVFGDIFVHREDAHRHFWPLTDWRLISPVSYWDRRHYGDIFMWFELVLMLVCIAVLWKRYTPSLRAQLLIASLPAIYVLMELFWHWT